MFPSLLPRTAPFFELLIRQNQMLEQAARNLVALLEQPDAQDSPHKQVALLEEEADLLYAHIIRELSQTFITPIDREDILRISQCQEESIDFIHSLSTRLHIYEFHRIRFPALQLMHTMEAMIRLTLPMLEGLSRRKDCHKTRDFRILRGECEMLLGVGIAELYDVKELTPQVMLELVKWGQAYDRMELAVDKVVLLAETIQEAVLKNV